MSVANLVAAFARRFLGQRAAFGLAYRSHRTPWDTNITPPELVRVVEGSGPEHLAPGRALDLGCGTGTNSLYLARHGWQVTGIDFIAAALAQARAKQARAGALPGAVEWRQGDVTRLEALDLRPGYDLIFDLGCFHGIPATSRAAYASGITRLAAPDATLLLYAFGPATGGGLGPAGLTRDALAAVFAPAWRIAQVEDGSGPGGRPSAWYWLRREAPPESGAHAVQ